LIAPPGELPAQLATFDSDRPERDRKAAPSSGSGVSRHIRREITKRYSEPHMKCPSQVRPAKGPRWAKNRAAKTFAVAQAEYDHGS
jgi:hypothetical protein